MKMINMFFSKRSTSLYPGLGRCWDKLSRRLEGMESKRASKRSIYKGVN